MNEYPFASHFFDRDGVRLHYLDEGQGVPVVMVHGNPTWSFYYRRLVTALRDQYRVIVPDHVGCGLSDKPARYNYSLQQRIDDLEALLLHLGITEKIQLVVHDWGGMIGMGLAQRHPQWMERFVVLNTAAFHLPAGKTLPWTLRLSRTPILGALLVRGLNLFCRGAARYGVTRRPLSPETRAGLMRPYDSWANRVAVLRFVQDIPLNPKAPAYALVNEIQASLPGFQNTPTLICWGERDFVFDRDFLAEWQRYFPHAHVHRFPDAGHYILEDAHEEIIPLVQDFLRSPAS